MRFPVYITGELICSSSYILQVRQMAPRRLEDSDWTVNMGRKQQQMTEDLMVPKDKEESQAEKVL